MGFHYKRNLKGCKMDIKKVKKLSKKIHRERHNELHKNLDELIADWINHTGKLPRESTVYELMIWSHEQTLKPLEK
jgi:hypothetical protein